MRLGDWSGAERTWPETVAAALLPDVHADWLMRSRGGSYRCSTLDGVSNVGKAFASPSIEAASSDLSEGDGNRTRNHRIDNPVL